MLDIKKHNIVFDVCKGLTEIVASQIKEPNDNLSIATTSGRQIDYGVWPSASINGSFRYQSEVTRALLNWSDVAVFLYT